MNKEELIEGWVELLQRYQWSWIGCMTFRRSPVTPSLANRIFRRWLLELKAIDGDSDFRWASVMERGVSGEHIHFHFVVGGLIDGDRPTWLLRMVELAGVNCWLKLYDPAKGGLAYLVKEAMPGKPFDIDFDVYSRRSLSPRPPRSTAPKSATKRE